MNPEQQQPVNYGYGAAPAQSSQKKTFTMIMYGLGVVMVIFIILAVVLSGNTTSSDLSKLYAQQLEIARVADIGVGDDSSTQNTKNIASTIKLTALSATTQLARISGGASDTIIAEFTDTSADTLLEEAKKTNEFNDAFSQIMGIKLNSALTSINSVDSDGLDSDEKVVLDDLSASYTLLVKAFDS